MQNIGIVAEFNPFHYGHKYLIDCAKKHGNAVICVMSGNFVQRGDIAITDKFTRAEMAVRCGADLVLELPTPWAMSTAQNFAFGAVSILNALNITDKIMFGSECGDIDLLIKTADIISSPEFCQEVNLRLKKYGETFAAARSRVLKDKKLFETNILDNPNDTLGTEYILSARKLDFPCEFECVKRIGAKHDSSVSEITASASLIREKIKQGNYTFLEKYMPIDTYELLKSANISDISKLETAILCRLRTLFSLDNPPILPDASEGIENRLKKAVMEAGTLEELYSLAKTKRYTLARIRRLVLSAFLEIDDSFFGKTPPYIRVLAFSSTGEKLLRDAAKKASLPIITKVSKINLSDEFTRKVWETEVKATDIYSLSITPPQKCGNEYYKKIIKLL